MIIEEKSFESRKAHGLSGTSPEGSYLDMLWGPEFFGVVAVVVVIVGGVIRLKRAIPVDPSSISLLTVQSEDLSDFAYDTGQGLGPWLKRSWKLMMKPKEIFVGFWKKMPTRIWNFYIDSFIVPSYREEWGKYQEWSYRSPVRSKKLPFVRTEAKLRKLETDEQRLRRSTNVVHRSLSDTTVHPGKKHKKALTVLAAAPPPHNHCECQRVRINVGGCIYETQLRTLHRYPDTLLGNPQRRFRYYNPLAQEYFFDRNRSSFETILYFYQSGGRFRKPDNLPADILLDDAKFYGLPQSTIHQFLIDEGLTYATQPDDLLPSNLFIRKIWLLFEYPESSLQARIVAIISIVAIITNITTFCLETEDILAAKNDFDIDDVTGLATQRPFNPLNIQDPFFTVETVCCAWFSLEYLARLISCPDKSKFLINHLNIIDFIAIVPYFLQIVISSSPAMVAVNPGMTYHKSATSSFSTVRVVRLVRVFRIFKLSRHSKGLKILGKTLHASMNELMLLIMFVIIGVILFSSCMYFAEMGGPNNQFLSIPQGFWWAVITITTLGYGDIVPDTPIGKVIGALCAVTGVLTIALPVPVIVSNFNFFYNQAIGEQDLSWLKISHVPACPYRPMQASSDMEMEESAREKKPISSGEEPGELKKDSGALVKREAEPSRP